MSQRKTAVGMMKRIAAILVMITLCASLTSAFAADAIQVKFTFAKEEYKTGEEISVKYTISGGSGKFETFN